MKKTCKLTLSLLLVLIMTALPLCVGAFASDGEMMSDYVEGEIVISSSEEIEDSHGMLRTASNDDVLSIDFDDVGITTLEKIDADTDENIYVAEVNGDVRKICGELNADGAVVAEPNYILTTSAFDMPGEIKNSIDFYTANQKWYFNDILHIPDAWKFSGVTGEGVTVAVIDNGFYLNAPDFPTNLWKNSGNTVGWNTNTDSDEIGPILKSDGVTGFEYTSHGSNIAGIIGMTANGTGGIGVAYGAQLMLIKAAHFVDDNTNPQFSMSDVIEAIDLAKDNGADIINLSMSMTTKSTLLENAVNRAYNAGVALFAAAGNNSKSSAAQKIYPAAYENVIGVMATDKNSPDSLADFSNYDSDNGMYYQIAAPGVGIIGCSCENVGYSRNSGTSQCAPIVAGCAALYRSLYPTASVQDVYNAIKNSNGSTVTVTSTCSVKLFNPVDFLKQGGKTECAVHTDGEWVVTKQPTESSTGIRTLYCSVCGKAIKTQTISALSHGGVSSVKVSDASIFYKKSVKLNMEVSAESGVKYDVKYTSSNPKVATVDDDGKVYGAKRGSATITCTVTDELGNTVSDTCTVKVSYAWWQWIIVIVLFGWIWY